MLPAPLATVLAPAQIVNPLIPPLPVLFGIVGGVVLLLIVGAAVAAILLWRKR